MKVLIDMNLSPVWASFLIGNGHEAWHWSEIGRGAAPDSELIQWARTHEAVILTQDRDFGTTLARGDLSSPSVIQIRSGLLIPRTMGERLLDLLVKVDAELKQGCFVSLDASKTRVTILPISRKQS